MKTMISYGIKRFVIGGLAGGCLALALAAPAFAGEPGQVEPRLGAAVILEYDAGNASSAVSRSHEGSGDGYASAALREKHREVDEFLFKENEGSFPEHGFTVTHTGPVGDRIEIGILPYDEAHAEFLLGVFGSESVSVVEGVQAFPLVAVEEPVAPDAAAGGAVHDGDIPVNSAAGISGTAAATAQDMPASLANAGEAREIAAGADAALPAGPASPEDPISGMEIALYALAAAAGILIVIIAMRKLRIH